MDKKEIDKIYYSYVEDGYLSEEIEESEELEQINKLVVSLYNKLTKKKKEELDQDLEDLQIEVKELLINICENILITYKNKLKNECKKVEGIYIDKVWELNPSLNL